MIKQIVFSEGLEKYSEIIKEILHPFGPELKCNGGLLGIIDKPVDALFVLNKRDFELLDNKINSYTQCRRVANKNYNQIKNMTVLQIKEFLDTKPLISLRATPAYWFPIPSQANNLSFKNINLVAGESYIAICPELIAEFADKINQRMQNEDGGIYQHRTQMLRIVLIHELGHHYSYSNIPYDEFIQNRDLNMTEGLAQWFAFQFLDSEGRRMLSEASVSQDICYRYFHRLRYANLTQVLETLIEKRDHISALKNFAEIVGAKFILNGHTLTVGKNIDMFMDFSEENKGGNIIAGDVGILLPILKGNIISPHISEVAGRFPSETLVISNKIDRFPDYVSLPQNIKIIDPKKHDLANIINKFKQDGLRGENLVRAILQELQIDPSS